MSRFAPGAVPPEPPDLEVKPPNFKQAGQGIAEGFNLGNFWTPLIDGIKTAIIDLIGIALGIYTGLAGKLGIIVAKGIIEAEERNDETYATLAAVAVEDLLGVRVNTSAFIGSKTRDKRTTVASSIGEAIITSLFGADGGSVIRSIEPGDAQAKKYLGVMVQLSIEGWLSGWTAELAGLGELETFGELDDILAQTLGFGRLSRRVLSPFVDVYISTPVEWKLNKAYRPTLLATAEAVRQFHRGRWTREQLTEELARRGYSEDRIEALVNAGAKFLSVGDLGDLVREKLWTRAQAITHLQDNGYSATTAATLLELERIHRFGAFRERYVATNTAAFVRGDIDETDWRVHVNTMGLDPDEVDFQFKIAERERELQRKRLSEGDADQAVKRGILTFTQWRAHRRALNYSDRDILTQELLLLDEIKTASDAKRERDRIAQEHATEQAERRREADARKREIAERQSRQELSLAQVERAVVRGIMTVQQYDEFLTANKVITEDRAVLVELIQEDRAQYVANQQRQTDAEQRLAAKGLSLAQLQKAVELRAISYEEFQETLEKQGLSSHDIQILVAETRADITERADAAARREQIANQLKVENISLDQLERSVRDGFTTMAEYRRRLAERHYSAADQEILTALLERTIQHDGEAREKRRQAEARLAQKKISLSDLARAVQRGIRPIGDYRALLLAEDFSVDDTETLVQLLESDIAEDRAARARKAQLDEDAKVRQLPLADIERAVLLGKIGIDRYRQALKKAKFSSEDQDLLVAVLVADVQDFAEARRKRTAAEDRTKHKTVSLGELRELVKRKLARVEDYQVALFAEGYKDPDVLLLSNLLRVELADIERADRRRTQLDAERSTREISRVDLERAVKAGVRTIEDYVKFLRAEKYSLDDQETLVGLLLVETVKPQR